jgi:hypothetical protein
MGPQMPPAPAPWSTAGLLREFRIDPRGWVHQKAEAFQIWRERAL